MNRPEARQHARQGCPRIGGRDLPAGALDGNADKTKLRNRRGQQKRFPTPLHLGDPRGSPRMLGMISPAPSHEQIHIEEVPHGKSASRPRTDSVVRGALSGAGAKIMAPVYWHGTRPILPGRSASGCARLRRYSETDMFWLLASSRIWRASTAETLNVIVGMGNTVIPGSPYRQLADFARPVRQGSRTFRLIT